MHIKVEDSHSLSPTLTWKKRKNCLTYFQHREVFLSLFRRQPNFPSETHKPSPTLLLIRMMPCELQQLNYFHENLQLKKYHILQLSLWELCPFRKGGGGKLVTVFVFSFPLHLPTVLAYLVPSSQGPICNLALLVTPLDIPLSADGVHILYPTSLYFPLQVPFISSYCCTQPGCR